MGGSERKKREEREKREGEINRRLSQNVPPCMIEPGGDCPAAEPPAVFPR